MAKRRYDQNTLELGQWNAECDVCGFKFKSGDLKERWDGLYVCRDDWEERHPSDFFRARQEDQSTPWTRPEDSITGGTDIDGDTYPPSENTTQTDIGIEPSEGTFNTNNETL